MGPAIQDIWMWLAGDRSTMQAQLVPIIDGYREFNDFDESELVLIEALRTLRLIHYSGWLAQRWDDPAFPQSFPFFNTQRYWQDQILALREQAAALDEGTVNSWLAASVFEQLLESVDLTWLKTAVLEPIVYNGAGDSRGLTPALTTTATDPARPRAFNDTVTFSVTRVGAPLLLDRRFFDPYSGRFVRGPSTR